MIGIRTDANDTIALGHMMRCIAIAEQIKKIEKEVIFITSDHFGDKVLDEKGFKHICLDTNWMNKESELDKLQIILKEVNIKILLIDSYEVTQDYLNKLHEVVKLAYIDDLYLFEYPVDLVINYFQRVRSERYKNYISKSVKFLLGSNYVPLRNEFQNKSLLIKEQVSDVLITTGGSDNYHIIYQLLQKLTDKQMWSTVKLHVVVGQFFTNIDELERLLHYNRNIILHKNVKNMADIMMQCDIAISAGGTTLSELCACGVPTICFAMADNQLEGVESFGEEKIMISVGDIRIDFDDSINNIVSMLENLKDNLWLRNEYSTNAKGLIDGYGARRIAGQLIKL